ncbi:MAG: RNA polymerase sigma factor [Nannocystaceae bacterium]
MAKQSPPAGLYAAMARYADGDRRAFDRLYSTLSPRLRGFLMKIIRDEPTVEDLIQLTMLKAHLARNRFELQGGNPDGAVQAWYFAIARNVAMDHLRKQYRKDKRLRKTSGTEAQDPVAALVDEAPTIEDLGISHEAEQHIISEVQHAISKLPPGQREVVELHKLRGMSMSDIAARLEIREGAVRVRAHRAYKALARMLSPQAMLFVFWGFGG